MKCDKILISRLNQPYRRFGVYTKLDEMLVSSRVYTKNKKNMFRQWEVPSGSGVVKVD